MYRLEPETSVDLQIDSPDRSDNVRLDFNPTENRITVSLQARVGRITLLLAGGLTKEWSAGALPPTPADFD